MSIFADWGVNKLANMSPKKTPVIEQEPEVRNKNFNEVSLGYDEIKALEEAERCISCKNRPCVEGCPVNVQIPEFISFIKQKDFEGAYKKIKETSNLPAICGRVCPQESQCESKCTRGIKGEAVGIGRLERFAADWGMKNLKEKAEIAQKNGHKVAIVGGGPAGITCAADLAKMGYEVTLFDAFHTPGGVLMYGIPEFRLPKEIVKKEIENIKTLGVEIKPNVVIGRTLDVDDIFEMGYEAVFIGSGAGLPNFMKIEGEDLNGVYSANEFLTRINLMKAYDFPEHDTPIKVGKKACIVGGGNVAMDAARCAKRLGAEEVTIVYRRSEEEMPARLEEIHHAKQEGIQFSFLTNPTKIIGTENGWVKGIGCIKMELGEPDQSGRRRPQVVAGSEHIIEAETVVIAIGQSPNPLIQDTTRGLELTKHSGIVADENGRTSRPGVFAGGDIVTGAATVILAMGAGQKAAAAIDEYIKSIDN